MSTVKMEEEVLNMKKSIFFFFVAAMATVSCFVPSVSSLSNEAEALMAMKASFGNVANVLLDWTNENDDYCSWRGVLCDNATFAVVSLNLSSLNLGGEISPSVGDLKSLETIDLKRNRLTGQIPDEIGDCVSLRYLDLSGNSLYGDIPFSISKLKLLEELDLKNNQLTGPIPSTLSQIPNLKTLDLAQNQLTGEIPRLIYWNEVLQYLGLRGNSLTGTLSPDMCQLTGLWYFDVRGNNLTGTIPDSIGNCTSFEILSLQGNRLIGKIPEVIGLMQALAVLDLSENELVGTIPPILGNLTYTGKLYLHSNKFTGPIPPMLGNMTKLSYLNLANNNLEGPIPRNISSCTALNQFNVHGNKLNGTIPTEFQNLESLTYLNFSSNRFNGAIPVELGKIVNLDTLDLSNNDFTGSIPDSVGDLEHLLQLNLSRNNLNGQVPAEFGNLRSIQVMDISHNMLSGMIPEEMGQLQNIEALILNNNQLEGEIPIQLANCFSLSTLNLSYNNFSGEIPQNKNFSKFPPESFLGNPLLCGPWESSCGLYGQNSKGAIYRTQQPKPYIKGLGKPMQGPPKLVVLQMDMAVHTYEDIMRVTDNLSEKYIVGYGASSTVYKCVVKNAKPIAIKRLYDQYPHNLRVFENELETIGSIRHRNLVSLHGYSLSPLGNLLFYEYMENGSLWDLLHGPSTKVKLDWDTRLRIAVGAAQGLAYLHHDCNPRIIHRDVKSSNILLDENFEAHISDFGIAKSISSSKMHASTFVMGTIGYIDPEYARTSRLNEKSDVYSFGIVLLELLTGKKAVDNESNLHQLILSKADDNTVMEAVDTEVSVTCMDLGLVRKTFQLALLCTKRSPLERPNMHEVARVLVSLLPTPPTKAFSAPVKQFDYARFLADTDGKNGESKVKNNSMNSSSCSSGAQWSV
ncbi:LRR receptor-like serine/threonine-protein kinase ERL2 [Acorus gramineus]|uniref:non-specific serine/threonine protein kinase n=1 Tax=Acorus gramineus TaxID=55184 RepID=A0AAV9BD24_ACOGR|nr:LRR receptor-like serine/threonine-protein kinase ERL2 [Acorus gramineus]